MNHSSRKTLAKKLRGANVERQSIIHITRHTSEQPLQYYDEGTKQEQQVLSNVIINHQQLPIQANTDRGPQFFVPRPIANTASTQM